MKTTLSILVFMLVHGRAVCNELYPISIFKDQDQNDYQNDDTEPAQGKSVVANDVEWIVTDIVGPYGFTKHKTKDEWVSQPTFQGILGNKKFMADGTKAEAFFKQNNDWNTMKATRSCLGLLYITAARYVLVTKILYEQSGYKLTPCVKTAEKKYEIPDSGVCFPPPYGSATCTSDYDVGLIGKDAGILTKKFNDYFQAPTPNGFGKPSEVVFDTNIYAFTLEFALPFMFLKLPQTFIGGVEVKEGLIDFKMQEVASAYYKVFKYDEYNFFDTLVTGAKNAMGKSVQLDKLNYWLGIFQTLPVKLRVQDFNNVPETLRTRHNAKYQELVEKMSKKGGYDPELIGTLAKALIYAAEAYHTRGAIRHVVGGTQMKVVDLSLRTPLSTTDLWVSMIENWGEANKEYSHYKTAPLVKCFLKMSKYMWRMFNAMRLIRNRIPPEERHSLVRFGEQFGDPEYLMLMWLQYKKRGASEIPETVQTVNDIKSFLQQFGCDQAVLNVNQPLPAACLTKMNVKVNDYNVKLAALAIIKAPWKGGGK